MTRAAFACGSAAVAFLAAPIVAQTAPPAPATAAGAPTPSTVARAFGAREYIQQISLSPDGKRVAIVSPMGPRGTQVLVADPMAGGDPVSVLLTDGVPQNLRSCTWITDVRLACSIAFVSHVSGTQYTVSKFDVRRMIAVNSDGSGMKTLSADQTSRSLEFTQDGGSIIDWAGDGKGAVLMTRDFRPENTLGTRLASSAEGLGVERVDTVSLRRTSLEPARQNAVEYLTDGQGTVRMMGVMAPAANQQVSDRINYSYRKPGSRTWEPLSETVSDGGGQTRSGFNPYAVDHATNAVYGVSPLDGRLAPRSRSTEPEAVNSCWRGRTWMSTHWCESVGSTGLWEPATPPKRAPSNTSIPR